MGKNLLLSNIRVVEYENVSRLYVDIKPSDGDIYPFYYEVEKKYGKYFSYEVYDHAVVGLLLYAMEHQYDIDVDGLVSEDLLFQISNYLIPAIAQYTQKFSSIRIDVKGVSNQKFNGTEVGSAMSCGVDAFYTILKNSQHSKESGLNVSLFTFFNAGSCGNYGGEEARELYLKRAERSRKVADKFGMDFLAVDTNLNEFLHQLHEGSSTSRALSVPLAMQKLFGRYYLAAGYPYDHFGFDQDSMAAYDLLLVKTFSTRNVVFELVGAETTRMEKVKFISNNDVVKESLNVCIKTDDNCGLCKKCKRTLLELYILGIIDGFNQCFDLQKFEKNKKKILRWSLSVKNGTDMGEIVYALKKRHEYTLIDYIIGLLMRFKLNLIQSIRRKQSKAKKQ